MNQTATFGRRQSGAAAPQVQPRPAVRLPAREDYAHILEPDAAGEDVAFDAWRRAQSPRWMMAWLASLALCAPGVICFLLHVPRPVAAGVEVAGMVATLWLRRQRRRRLTQISGWTPG
jgi:hypothetical protein